MSEHLAAFLGGTILAQLTHELGLDLVAGTFDGDETGVSFLVEGRAGTRIRVTVAVESADTLEIAGATDGTHQ